MHMSSRVYFNNFIPLPKKSSDNRDTDQPAYRSGWWSNVENSGYTLAFLKPQFVQWRHNENHWKLWGHNTGISTSLLSLNLSRMNQSSVLQKRKSGINWRFLRARHPSFHPTNSVGPFILVPTSATEDHPMTSSFLIYQQTPGGRHAICIWWLSMPLLTITW